MRITPAYAGKRVAQAAVRKWMEDHPRLRGEKRVLGKEVRDIDGSPPLTRGKEYSTPASACQGGITPPYAGKRSFDQKAEAVAWDHPRLRGEKKLFLDLWQVRIGSPPLTRGKEGTAYELRYRLRITPAYAGKRMETTRMATNYRDHPRLRGEKISIFSAKPSVRGSPPLTRGKVKRRKL